MWRRRLYDCIEGDSMYAQKESHVDILCSSSCFVMELVSSVYMKKGLNFKTCPLPSMIYFVENKNEETQVNLNFGLYNVSDVDEGSWIEIGMFAKEECDEISGLLIQDTRGLATMTHIDFYYIEDVESYIYRLRIPLFEGSGKPTIREMRMSQMGDLRTELKSFQIH